MSLHKANNSATIDENALEIEREVSLIEATNAGNVEAFSELFEVHRPFVFSMAFSRLKNYADAEDLTQEVFMQAFKKIHTLKEPKAFKKWISVITRNRAVNFLLRGPRAHVTSESVLYGIDNNLPEHDLLSEEIRQQVRDAIAELGAIDQRVLQQFYFSGMSMNQMCEASDDRVIPLGTIKRRLFTARNRLKAVLEKTSDITGNLQSELHSDGPAHVA